MSKVLARRVAKRPRWGEPIMRDDGVHSTITELPLYQPAAPRFFEVTDATGRKLFISWRGSAWMEYHAAFKKILGEHAGPGDEENSRGPDTEGRPSAAAGSTPASPAELPTPTKEPDSPGVQELSCGIAPRTCGRTEEKRSGESGSLRSSPAGAGVDEVLARRRPASRQAPGGGVAESNGAWAKPVRRASPPRSGAVAELHARLDAARAAYAGARDRDDAAAMLELGPAYHALIAAVDAAAPSFYGRPKAEMPVSFRADRAHDDAADGGGRSTGR